MSWKVIQNKKKRKMMQRYFILGLLFILLLTEIEAARRKDKKDKKAKRKDYMQELALTRETFKVSIVYMYIFCFWWLSYKVIWSKNSITYSQNDIFSYFIIFYSILKESKRAGVPVNPIALRETKLAYNCGLSRCDRVKHTIFNKWLCNWLHYVCLWSVCSKGTRYMEIVTETEQ